MLTPENSQLSPREHILIENEKEENRLAREHAVTISKMNLEQKKTELQMRQLDAEKARKHQEYMQELELGLRALEVKWNQIFRIPLTILKLPVYMIFAISYCICVATKQEPSNEFWKYLR